MKQIIFGNHKNIIGKTLFRIRKEKHISQGELAAKMQLLNCNIDQQMISRIEKNQRQVTDYEFACFCVCLDVKTDDMLTDFYSMINKD